MYYFFGPLDLLLPNLTQKTFIAKWTKKMTKLKKNNIKTNQLSYWDLKLVKEEIDNNRGIVI